MSDIEIAQAATMQPIVELVGSRYGIASAHLVPYGHYKAKLSLDYIRELEARPDGKLVLVTAISATPAPGVAIEGIEAAAMDVTTRFLREGPTTEELKRAKDMIAASAIFARDNFDWQDRELATLGALAVQPGLDSQLASHMRISRNVD